MSVGVWCTLLEGQWISIQVQFYRQPVQRGLLFPCELTRGNEEDRPRQVSQVDGRHLRGYTVSSTCLFLHGANSYISLPLGNSARMEILL
jgi:hypothetical protein